MTESEKHIELLFTAELQFRLASAVRLSLSEKYLSKSHIVLREHFDHKMLWPNRALFE
jgi:hypothetical protein